jgi:S1-C subfamily serine protease
MRGVRRLDDFFPIEIRRRTAVRNRVVSLCAWVLALVLAPREVAAGPPPAAPNQGQQAASGAVGERDDQPGNANKANTQGQGNPSADANKQPDKGQSGQPSNASKDRGQGQANQAATGNKAQNGSNVISNRIWNTTGANGSQGVDWLYSRAHVGQVPDQSQALIFGWVDQASRNSGMTLAPADAALRAHLKLSEDSGLIVTAVEPGSPAATVGLHQNDVVLRVAGDNMSLPTAKPEDLEAALKAFGESPITIHLLRGGQQTTVKVQPKIHASLGPVRPEPLAYWIGVTVSPVDPALRSQLQLPEKQGLLVTEVDKFGPAARAGVRPFDILRKFGGVDVVDQAGLTKLVQSRADQVVAIELLREGKPQEVKVVPQRRQSHASTINLNPDIYNGGVWDLVFTDQGQAQPNVSYNFTLPQYSLDSLTVPQGYWVSNNGNWFYTRPDNNAANANASVDRKIDELSKQIQELRQAIDALAKSQMKR